MDTFFPIFFFVHPFSFPRTSAFFFYISGPTQVAEAADTIFFTRSNECTSNPPPSDLINEQFSGLYGGSTRISFSTRIDSPFHSTSLHAFSNLSNIFCPSGDACVYNNKSKSHDMLRFKRMGGSTYKTIPIDHIHCINITHTHTPKKYKIL